MSKLKSYYLDQGYFTKQDEPTESDYKEETSKKIRDFQSGILQKREAVSKFFESVHNESPTSKTLQQASWVV